MTLGKVVLVLMDIVKMEPKNLCFCGGEPFLRKDLMIECAKVLRRKPYGMISLVTNGLLVDEVSAKQVVENGIRRVQVSMDGARPEFHSRTQTDPPYTLLSIGSYFGLLAQRISRLDQNSYGATVAALGQ